MRILYFAVIIAITAGSPVFNEEGSDTTESEEIVFHYHSIGNGLAFAWKVTRSSLLVSVKLPVKNRWLVLGFDQSKGQEGSAEMDGLAFIKIKQKSDHVLVVVKTADWSDRQGFSQADYTVWEKEETSRNGNVYQLTFSRPLEGLDLNKPMKLIYGYGIERKVSEINRVFYSEQKQLNITLSSHDSLIGSKSTTTTTAEPSTAPSILTVQTIGIIATEKIAVISKTPASVNKEKTNANARVSPTKALIKNATAALTSKKEVSKLLSNTTTPCPEKCNCTRKEDNSHWYNILRAKENTMYYAIIGSAALFTGLIVLCIACCCARGGKPKIPRTRKHKVAFYKVDDFDTDDEEEMEFIEGGKEAQ